MTIYLFIDMKGQPAIYKQGNRFTIKKSVNTQSCMFASSIPRFIFHQKNRETPGPGT